jgi:hypothetical protein
LSAASHVLISVSLGLPTAQLCGSSQLLWYEQTSTMQHPQQWTVSHQRLFFKGINYIDCDGIMRWGCWNRDAEQEHSCGLFVNGIFAPLSVDVGSAFEDTKNPHQTACQYSFRSFSKGSKKVLPGFWFKLSFELWDLQCLSFRICPPPLQKLLEMKVRLIHLWKAVFDLNCPVMCVLLETLSGTKP